jgi:hypothetical protein
MRCSRLLLLREGAAKEAEVGVGVVGRDVEEEEAIYKDRLGDQDGPSRRALEDTCGGDA